MNKILLSEGYALFELKVAETKQHSHYAIQVILGIEQDIKVRSTTGTWIGARGAIISSNEPHQIDSLGANAIIFYIDPNTKVGRLYKKKKKITIIPKKEVQLLLNKILRINLELDVARSLFQIACKCLEVDEEIGSSFKPLDERITKIIKIIHSTGGLSEPCSHYASLAALSIGRFQHLFKEEIGLPFRRYLLWIRLTMAITYLNEKKDLTYASHQSGFSDSAHLTRTFKSMFGVTPSSIFYS